MSRRARERTVFRCRECGSESARWEGRCPTCSAWNALVEEVSRAGAASRGRNGQTASGRRPVRLADVDANSGKARIQTALGDLDRVLGGGIVRGSVLLLAGEPGIGKSTLLLQAAARLRTAGRRVLYVTGEESAAQVRVRADRLEEVTAGVQVLAETDVERIVQEASRAEAELVIADSVQTLVVPELGGAAGSVGQVRESAARLQRLAKEREVAVVLIGHVTKGGAVAGPKVLEHLVDVVLRFDGLRSTDHRLVRGMKNRFGAADEIAVYEMTSVGLAPVDDPSGLFRGAGEPNPGAAIAISLEGSRPLPVEVQALVAPSSYGSPQRVATGFDGRRLALLLAVLERRAGFRFGKSDVFVSVTGGFRIRDPGADLAVAAALVSAAADLAVPPDTVFVGEIGLTGEVRRVPGLARRSEEARRTGFRRIVTGPEAGGAPAAGDGRSVTIPFVRDLRDVIAG